MTAVEVIDARVRELEQVIATEAARLEELRALRAALAGMAAPAPPAATGEVPPPRPTPAPEAAAPTGRLIRTREQIVAAVVAAAGGGGKSRAQVAKECRTNTQVLAEILADHPHLLRLNGNRVEAVSR